MGVGTIMEARKVFRLTFGESNAQAIGGAVEGSRDCAQPGISLATPPVDKGLCGLGRRKLSNTAPKSVLLHEAPGVHLLLQRYSLGLQ